MTTCSTYNNGATSLSKSRIRIARHEGYAVTGIDEESELIFTALSCRQCDEAFCMHICPSGAIVRHKDTGAMVVNYDRCIGCRMCIAVCPFGAIMYDADRRRVIKCDLCGGEPQCVRLCPTRALEFLPKKLAHLPKSDRLAKRIVEIEARAAIEDIPASREEKSVNS